MLYPTPGCRDAQSDTGPMVRTSASTNFRSTCGARKRYFNGCPSMGQEVNAVNGKAFPFTHRNSKEHLLTKSLHQGRLYECWWTDMRKDQVVKWRFDAAFPRGHTKCIGNASDSIWLLGGAEGCTGFCCRLF